MALSIVLQQKKSSGPALLQKILKTTFQSFGLIIQSRFNLSQD